MLYSLSRFRALKPSPPFQLGGEYLGNGHQHFLVDALGSLPLMGPPELFSGLHDGDLVVVDVERAEESKVHVHRLRVEVRCQDYRAIAPKPAARFAAFVQRVRAHLLSKGLNEVLTPTLVRCPGLEPTLEPFSTEVVYGARTHTAYLPTSPEIHLKKAMAQGWTDIFEIKNCFRKGEFGAHHESEFLMLEWYRGYADLDLIEQDLRELLFTLGEEGWVDGDLGQLQVTDWATLFKDHFHFEMTPRTRAEELKTLCIQLGVHITEEDSFNDLFHRLVVDRLEAEMAKMGPLIVRRFPPSQAALAKLDKDGWADRFEFYWRGLEIANAFNEVNDPLMQAQRWEAERAERQRLGTSLVPEDARLIEAFRRGMPPAGGIALGLERLFMAAARVDNIRELKLFSVNDLFSEPE